MISKLHQTIQRVRRQRGITGLETAIILIAFVVVATVFAYVVISTGIFAADKGKEAAFAGLDRARKASEIVGSIKAIGVTATTLENADTAATWTPSAQVTAATETNDRKEGTASLRLAVAGAFTTGIVAYRDLGGSTVNITDHYSAGLWVKANAPVAAGVLELLLDNDGDCSSPLETLAFPALTANTWQRVQLKLSDPTALAAVDCVAINAASDPGIVTLTADLVEAPGEATTFLMTLSNPLDGVSINLASTVDSNSDGLLSDEGGSHTFLVSYLDEDQLLHDLAWTTTQLGRGDGDVVLESGEKIQISVDLRAADPVPTANTIIILHFRPQDGAVMVLEKRLPGVIDRQMLLN